MPTKTESALAIQSPRNLEVPKEKKQVLLQRVEKVNKWATELLVKDDATYEFATEGLGRIKTVITECKSIFDPFVAIAQKAHKDLCNERGKYLKPLEDADRTVRDKTSAFIRARQEEARKQQAILDAQAAEKARKEQEALEAEAKKEEKAGNVEVAETLRTQAQQVTPEIVTVMPVIPKAAGVSTRTKWKGVVVDKAKLISAASTRPDLHALLIVDEKALRQLANSTEGKANVPGVRFEEDVELAVRAAA